MKNAKVVLVALALILGVSLSCKLLEKVTKKGSDAPPIDFTTPAPGLDVRVELDKKQTASGKIGNAGGSVSLTTADGSKFTLEVPANALNTETTITLTAVKTINGAPLATNTPTAVQFEPSGLLFNEIATLTIIPGKEIPVKEQVIFGYEGDGKDYHLMPVDPKSKDIRVRLTNFSGAGVGSAADTQLAAHLMIRARETAARIFQRFGEYSQRDRRTLLEGNEGDSNFHANYKAALDQYEKQVLTEIVAAQLDCRLARTALHHLISLEHMRALEGIPEGENFRENWAKLEKIGEKCRRPFRAAGTSNNVSFTGEICSLDKQFVLNGKFGNGSETQTFTPGSSMSGTVREAGNSGGCTQSGGGTYKIVLNEQGSGTLEFTETVTGVCGPFSNTKTVTFKVSLQPASDLVCP